MNSLFSNYLAEESWLFNRTDWHKEQQHTYESQFSQGNGYLGIRGIMEGVPSDSMPGTFIAGLYDKTSAQVTELVNLPNPIHFKITSGGEKFGLVAMDASRHQTCLDVKNGVLTHRALYEDSKKRRYDYQSMRFVSMEDKNTIVFRIYFTPLDHETEITVKTDIDVSTVNPGVLTEGIKQHYQVIKVHQSSHYDYLCVKTLEKETFVAFASTLSYSIGKITKITTDHAFKLKLKKNQTVCFTKIICIAHSNEKLPSILEEKALAMLEKSRFHGFEDLYKRHAIAMKKLWAVCDITIKGDLESQKAIRFNIYHLLICAPPPGGNASVGAKTMSGMGYRGHVFWDTEIFVFPFYLFTSPQTSRDLLLYRYYRLDAARENAKKNGYKGAQFPWESADSGCECTPEWAKNFDGKIIQVCTGQLEHHIVADVAYTFINFLNVTGDQRFFDNYGYEVLFETARFWASRLTLNKKTGLYEIRQIMGPDEFHENVNNNAYTNMMAKWNLLTAVRYYQQLKKERPSLSRQICEKISLSDREVKAWKNFSSKIVPLKIKNSVIEQFDNYSRKKYVRITKKDNYGMPDFPVGLDLTKISKTQLIKQSDVIMLLYLMSNHFSSTVKKKNYKYYLERTLHKSSLSPSIHSIIANEVGDFEKAFLFFEVALYMDLKNIYGNANDGIHAACLGGVWQAVVNGFAGLRLRQNCLSFDPKLPVHWKELHFSIFWRDFKINLSLSHKKLKIKAHAKTKKTFPLRVRGVQHKIRTNYTCVIPLCRKA